MSLTVDNFGEYVVKNVKSFSGMEGLGFNANLYRGKKKVAFLIDEGCGGEVHIDFIVGKSPKNRDDYPTEEAYKKAWEEYRAANKVEEDLLDAHVKTLPKVDSDWGGDPLTIDAGWFVTDCVTKWERDRDLRKMAKKCQTKTLYRTSDCKMGAYYIHPKPYSDALATAIRSKYGQDVEIFNEVIDKGGIPSVLDF
jgi:hypothetical protein